MNPLRLWQRARRIPLYWQIFAAILLSVITGSLLRVAASPEVLQSATSSAAFIGSLFIQALKMLIVPLIVSAVISAMSSIAAEHGFGRLAAKTLSYYLVTSLAAILVGLAVVNLIQPGIINDQAGYEAFDLPEPDTALMDRVGDRDTGDVIDIFKRMIPANVIATAAEGEMLGLIVFSILFGFFTTRLPGELRGTMDRFWTGLYEVMKHLTDFVMAFAPLGVFGLITSITAQTDPQAFLDLAWFPVAVLIALAIHLLAVLPLLLRLIARVSPIAHFRAMMPSLLTAFSTASSSATLPITIECLTDRAGVSRRVTHFTTPLGATVNMDGTALYECVAVIFLMQFFGLEISLGAQFIVVSLALLTSIGVAGIPAASLVAILIILDAVGLPPQQVAVGVALLQFTDRILDMCRTAVNVFGDSCGAVIIARSESETTTLVDAKPSTAKN